MNNASFFTYPEGEVTEQVDQNDEDQFVFLQDMSDEDWAKILEHTETLYFHIGDVIINVGETERSLFFVVKGKLEVLGLNTSSQHWYRITILEENSVFGEQAFFDGKPRSAAVRALTDGTLLRLNLEDFNVLAAREPVIARKIIFDLTRILSLRLRQANNTIASLTGQS